MKAIVLLYTKSKINIKKCIFFIISTSLFLFTSEKSFSQAASATWALTTDATASVTGNVTATSGTLSGATASASAYDATYGRGAYNWPTSNSRSTTKYYEFTVTPTASNNLLFLALP